ncbi:MAG: thymidine phosphorylase [Pirellulaceae bacterium]
MNVAQIICAKRDGKELEENDIRCLINGFTSGDVQDAQMSAFAMAVYFQGMTHRETASLTQAMLSSGDSLSFPNAHRKMVDKHSTGGIGDKISIPLAPILIASGLGVPMISGRGLGITGGTIDKLESIYGYRTDLTMSEIRSVVMLVGGVITAASKEIAPADKRFYALRDVTGTVPAIPLITASILSKKLAENLDHLILDVKWGSGAFMKSKDEATALARSLVLTANELGVDTRALLTNMDRPLGRMIGNENEIGESLDVLHGDGPDDVVELTNRLAAELFVMSGVSRNIEEGILQSQRVVRDGSALNAFREMVSAQGGDLDHKRRRGPTVVIEAEECGNVSEIDCEKLGLAIIEMGGGRKIVGQEIDHSVGIEMLVQRGDSVDRGQPIANLFVGETGKETATRLVRSAFRYTDQSVSVEPLIGETIDVESLSAQIARD